MNDSSSTSMGQVVVADWIIPISGPPLRDAALAFAAGRFEWLGPRRDLPTRFSTWSPIAAPNSVVLPGWVNSRARLDLSLPLQLPGGELDESAVARVRSLLPASALRQAITAGADLLMLSGVSTSAHCDGELGPPADWTSPLRLIWRSESAGSERLPVLGPRDPPSMILPARFALGIESLLEFGSLDFVRLLRSLADRHPEVSAEDWLRAATLDGAAALGLEREIGSLEPGKRADFQIRLLPEDPGLPASSILQGETVLKRLWIGGNPVRVALTAPRTG